MEIIVFQLLIPRLATGPLEAFRDSHNMEDVSISVTGRGDERRLLLAAFCL